MAYLKATQTYFHLIAAIFVGTLLVACGGAGSSTPAAVTSLSTTMTASSSPSSNVTGSITSDTVGNWVGNFTPGTNVLATLTGSGATVASANVRSTSSSTVIIPLSVTGYTFSPSGNITTTQYNALVAAGSTLIVEFVDSSAVTRSTALTRN